MVHTVLDNRIRQLQKAHDYEDNSAVRFSREEVRALLKCGAADQSTPRGLILRTFLLIALHTGSRVCEHHKLEVAQFKLGRGGKSGPEYYIIERRLDMNHRGGINALNEMSWSSKIWQNMKEDTTRFYLTPRRTAASSGPWFTRQPVGVNQFNVYVKELSGSVGLSYDNRSCHTFRRTIATWLYEPGWDTPTIMAVTKHKSHRNVLHDRHSHSWHQRCRGYPLDTNTS